MGVGWGVALICKGPGPAAAISGLCLLTCVSPACSPPRGAPLSVLTEPSAWPGAKRFTPMAGVTQLHFLGCHPASAGPQCCPQQIQGHGAQRGHDQTRRRMTARCLQPARDLGIQRHQKPSGPLSGPFLSIRRKLVFAKLVSPEAGQ